MPFELIFCTEISQSDDPAGIEYLGDPLHYLNSEGDEQSSFFSVLGPYNSEGQSTKK